MQPEIPKNWRELAIAEAKTWVGTRFHHAANIKGAGVDCVMLLVEVFKVAGIVPKDYDPRPYPSDWFVHNDEPRFLNGMSQFARRIEVPRPGDIAMFNYGRTAAHGAIIVADGYMVHAYLPARKVELTEIRSLKNVFDSYWTVL